MAYERREYAGAAPATTLTGPINNSVTSLTLTDGTGYPTGGTGPFFLVLSPGLSTEEKVKCTARSGASVTGVTRGADGTSAVAHSEANPAVKHVFTKTDADEANAHYADTALDHHTQYLLATGTRAFTGLTAIAGTPGSSALGDSVSAGTGNTLARANHVHGREASSLLAVTQYRSGTGYSTTSTSYVDVDATNVAVTFNAPANGKVLVRLIGVAYIDQSSTEMAWALRESSSNLASTGAYVYFNDTGSDHQYMLSHDIYVTGLVASSSHTYKWAYKSRAGNGVSILNGADYPVTMEVWAAP